MHLYIDNIKLNNCLKSKSDFFYRIGHGDQSSAYLLNWAFFCGIAYNGRTQQSTISIVFVILMYTTNEWEIEFIDLQK